MAQEPSSYEIIRYRFPADVERYISEKVNMYEKDNKIVSLFLSSQNDSTWCLSLDDSDKNSPSSYKTNGSNRKTLIGNKLYDVFLDCDESYLNASPEFTGAFGKRDGTIRRLYTIRESPYIVFSKTGIVQEELNLYARNCLIDYNTNHQNNEKQESVVRCGRIVYYFSDEQELTVFNDIEAIKRGNPTTRDNGIALLISHANGKKHISVIPKNNRASNRYALVGDKQYEVFFDYDDVFTRYNQLYESDHQLDSMQVISMNEYLRRFQYDPSNIWISPDGLPDSAIPSINEVASVTRHSNDYDAMHKEFWEPGKFAFFSSEGFADTYVVRISLSEKRFKGKVWQRGPTEYIRRYLFKLVDNDWTLAEINSM